MKSVLVACVFMFMLASSCKKHAIPPANQLSLLPPATQTGANTFGCLVNGQAFIPHNQNLLEGPLIQCNYIFTSGGYDLVVSGGNKNSDGSDTGINLETDSLTVADGQILPLTDYATPGMAYGTYQIFSLADIPLYQTSQKNPGQLHVTHLDTIKQIVSGTFYFNAVNSKGDTIKITNGRFDMHYTR